MNFKAIRYELTGYNNKVGDKSQRVTLGLDSKCSFRINLSCDDDSLT